MNPTLIDGKFSTCLLSRRIEAFQHLGIDKIPARIVDIDSILVGEYAENKVRKDFTQSERVAIVKAIETELGERR